MENQSVQDKYFSEGICFGCGPKNIKGLQIKTFQEGDAFIAHYLPKPEHQAFPGVINGGIIGALFDCHSNWAAAIHLMQRLGMDHPPCTVTADFHVTLLQPTPADQKLTLLATITESSDKKAQVSATLSAAGILTARCTGTFVAVKPDHPAYHRW